MTALPAAEKLPPGWTGNDKLPKKYSRLFKCAQTHNAVCQLWLGEIWNGEDFYSLDKFGASELYHPPEAERWFRSAARKGYRPAMDAYGFHLCQSKYNSLSGATTERIVEGLAWTIASGDYSKRDEVFFGKYGCGDFKRAIEAKSFDPQAILKLANNRVDEIRKEIEDNNGFRPYPFDFCTPFSWLDDEDSTRGFLRTCLQLQFKDIWRYLTD